MDQSLSKKEISAAILPSLKSASLVSLGQLCNDDCEVLLNKKTLTVTKKTSKYYIGTETEVMYFNFWGYADDEL